MVLWALTECAHVQLIEQIGKFPLIIRPAFTLGGTGGGIAYNMDEYHEIVHAGLAASLTNQARGLGTLSLEADFRGACIYKVMLVAAKDDKGEHAIKGMC